ncbi:armadillo-type protein [Mycena vulgaris]|nr:armadillo-type protein [Mycena vulgaris]
MLAQLATHEPMAVAAVSPKPCLRLVSLLRDTNTYCIESAMFALAVIAEDRQGAQAAVNAKVLDYVAELLDSSNHHTRRRTCKMLAHLAYNRSTVGAILHMEPCRRLLSLLRDESVPVIENAVFALSWIAQWPDGARAVADTKLLDGVMDLFHHPNNADVYCIEGAIFGLAMLTQWQEGAEVAVNANVVECAIELLDSFHTQLRRWACLTLGQLVHQKSTAVAVLEVKVCVRLVVLLRDEEMTVLESVIYVLSGIAQRPDGAQKIVDAEMVDCIIKLLDSPETNIQRWVGIIVGDLARHKSTAVAILAVKPCPRLVSLLNISKTGILP